MIQALSAYIKNIALFLVFMSVVTIIMPNGKYKDYISLCLGFILIFIIIQPLGGIIDIVSNTDVLLAEAYAITDVPYSAYGGAGGTAAGTVEEAENAQKEQILAEYRRMLEEQLRTLVDSQASISGYFYVESYFEIVNEGSGFGELAGVQLTVEKREGESTPKPFIRVEKVEIDPIPFFGGNGDNGDNRGQGDGLDKELEDERIISLKNAILDFYNMSADNIYIKVQE